VSNVTDVDDDNPHQETSDPWETETWWFSFAIPQDALLGYLYTFVRPNLGVCGGGAMVWDATAFLPWDVPYFEHQWTIPLPSKPGGPRLEFPNGMTVESLVPMTDYRVGYRGNGFEADLSFQAIMPANRFHAGKYPFVAAVHVDQPGRVTGTVWLDGRERTVDCLAMRDRSWGGPRTDLKNTRVSYAFAAASEHTAFLVFSRPRGGEERVTSGYLLRGDERADIVDGTRSTQRSSEGWPTRVTIDAVDALGRELHAVGDCVNRIVFTPYPKMLNWSSLTRWSFDDAEGWGEDQDVWPLEGWKRREAELESGRS
jgi:hypothetical protein